jgi:hypothetical protein
LEGFADNFEFFATDAPRIPNVSQKVLDYMAKIRLNLSQTVRSRVGRPDCEAFIRFILNSRLSLRGAEVVTATLMGSTVDSLVSECCDIEALFRLQLCQRCHRILPFACFDENKREDRMNACCNRCLKVQKKYRDENPAIVALDSKIAAVLAFKAAHGRLPHAFIGKSLAEGGNGKRVRTPVADLSASEQEERRLGVDLTALKNGCRGLLAGNAAGS